MASSSSQSKPYEINKGLWMVPCLVDHSKDEYEPLYSPYKDEIKIEKLQVRQTWLYYEDDALKEIVEKKGSKNWIKIADLLNDAVHKGIPMRQGKQCRERWFNHLNPNLKKGKWELSEDIAILEKKKEIGNRWSEIATCLSGRTENQVKNRFKSLIRLLKNHDSIDELIKKLKDKQEAKNIVIPLVINTSRSNYHVP